MAHLRNSRRFCGETLTPVSRHKTVSNVHLAEFFEIFQAGRAGRFARAFQNTGASTKAVIPIVGDGMIEQYLTSLPNTEQGFVGHEPQHFWVAVQSKKPFRVIFDKLSQQKTRGFEDHLHRREYLLVRERGKARFRAGDAQMRSTRFAGVSVDHRRLSSLASFRLSAEISAIRPPSNHKSRCTL